MQRTEVMARWHLLKLTVGLVAGAAALAASAQAAPLPPISPEQGHVLAHREGAAPAVVSQAEVDHLKPEQVRWGHHGHGHHWGWHHRHWHHRHWHHRHWHHHRW
jgi:hypothetical protein